MEEPSRAEQEDRSAPASEPLKVNNKEDPLISNCFFLQQLTHWRSSTCARKATFTTRGRRLLQTGHNKPLWHFILFHVIILFSVVLGGEE